MSQETEMALKLQKIQVVGRETVRGMAQSMSQEIALNFHEVQRIVRDLKLQDLQGIARALKVQDVVRGVA